MTDLPPRTPRAAILIDEPETVCFALSVLLRSFEPFAAKITGLDLCVFRSTGELASFELCAEDGE